MMFVLHVDILIKCFGNNGLALKICLLHMCYFSLVVAVQHVDDG
uniref:Uncharacterized protein n=1 Tax=Ciona intestinalis TaxID=7719 RepID=H2Y3H2_CIOIN